MFKIKLVKNHCSLRLRTEKNSKRWNQERTCSHIVVQMLLLQYRIPGWCIPTACADRTLYRCWHLVVIKACTEMNTFELVSSAVHHMSLAEGEGWGQWGPTHMETSYMHIKYFPNEGVLKWTNFNRSTVMFKSLFDPNSANNTKVYQSILKSALRQGEVHSSLSINSNKKALQ